MAYGPYPMAYYLHRGDLLQQHRLVRRLLLPERRRGRGRGGECVSRSRSAAARGGGGIAIPPPTPPALPSVPPTPRPQPRPHPQPQPSRSPQAHAKAEEGGGRAPTHPSLFQTPPQPQPSQQRARSPQADAIPPLRSPLTRLLPMVYGPSTACGRWPVARDPAPPLAPLRPPGNGSVARATLRAAAGR